VPQNYLHKLSNPAWPFHGTSVYEPYDGDILLFPSYLLHTIHRNDSNQQRINMAFDAIYLEK
jgi:ectoine hydroxylase-related dioxygenase (phytanoyl-CoA dioxygenase family)